MHEIPQTERDLISKALISALRDTTHDRAERERVFLCLEELPGLLRRFCELTKNPVRTRRDSYLPGPLCELLDFLPDDRRARPKLWVKNGVPAYFDPDLLPVAGVRLPNGPTFYDPRGLHKSLGNFVSELEKSWLLGPFEDDNFSWNGSPGFFHAIHVVPKKGRSHGRPIIDMRRSGTNEAFYKEEMPDRLPNFLETCALMLVGLFVFLADLVSAYRQVKIEESTQHLFCYSVLGWVLVDASVSFGRYDSAHKYQTGFVDILDALYYKHYPLFALPLWAQRITGFKKTMANYIDDSFWVTVLNFQHLCNLRSIVEYEFDLCGIAVHWVEAVIRGTETVTGYVHSPARNVVSYPLLKNRAVRRILGQNLAKPGVAKFDVQEVKSVAGKLTHISNVAPGLHPLITPLYTLIRIAQDRPFIKIKKGSSLYRRVKRYSSLMIKLLATLEPVPYRHILKLYPVVKFSIFTDASYFALGFHTESEITQNELAFQVKCADVKVFHSLNSALDQIVPGQFEIDGSPLRMYRIHILEAYALILAIQTFAELGILRNCTVQLYTDSTAAQGFARKNRCKWEGWAALGAALDLLKRRYCIHIHFLRVDTTMNTTADFLSRYECAHAETIFGMIVPVFRADPRPLLHLLQFFHGSQVTQRC